MKDQNKISTALIAREAFIRRAAQINLPFMLKGSFITRQYFPDPSLRIPADLDWLYLLKLENVDTARKTFDDWAIKVTELELNDGVRFRSFSENNFWRMIDYAMADDFPTINTDITCWVNGEELGFSMDVSFNLDIDYLPQKLNYLPHDGESFMLERTAPLSLQVSWKIHQTLVRPRFKDIFDLTHLLQHPDFNEQVLQQSLQALVNECAVDEVDLIKLNYLLNGNTEKLFVNSSISEVWQYWRHNIHQKAMYDIFYESADQITNEKLLPEDLKEFIELFNTALEYSGLTPEIMNHLPEPTNKKKETSKHTSQNLNPPESNPAETSPDFFTKLKNLFK